MSNVGGMQRVATELHSALGEREGVAMRTIALRSSWKWVHVKAVPFLVSLAARLRLEAAWFRADVILFTSMTTALPLLIAGPSLKKRGIRLAAIAHGLDVTDPNPAYQFAVRRLCKILDAVMPVSRPRETSSSPVVCRPTRCMSFRTQSTSIVLSAFRDRNPIPEPPRALACRLCQQTRFSSWRLAGKFDAKVSRGSSTT